MTANQNSFGFNVPVQVHADDPPTVYDVAIKGAKDGIRDASLEAYRELKDSGQLGKQELIICNALNGNPPMTLQEICKATGIQINAVAGRVNGLKKKRVLVETERRVCRVTGRVVTPVRVNR